MTLKEFAHATMLVASLRARLGHANALATAVTAERDDLAKQLSAHVESLKLSNAQCADYYKRIELLAEELARVSDRDKLHAEVVDIRAALASVSAERDSLKRTLKEWEEAETKPHARVAADDIADHVVPPVLPMCTKCHYCLHDLEASVFGPYHVCPTVGYPRTVTNNDDGEDKSPYNGPCTSSHAVRHE